MGTDTTEQGQAQLRGASGWQSASTESGGRAAESVHRAAGSEVSCACAVAGSVEKVVILPEVECKWSWGLQGLTRPACGYGVCRHRFPFHHSFMVI